MDKRQIEATICCMTYNHADYIEKTLSGFLAQETSFRYKVIVHDDASSDGTDLIIKKYAQEYPDIIYPILQVDNQYSKGLDLFESFIKPEIEGKYFALCEGDDYWTSKKKMQMQYDYMEKHRDCALCIHNTECVDASGKYLFKTINKEQKERDYKTEDIIKAGGGGLFHTSSFFMVTEYRLAFPNEFKIKEVGDYPLAIWCSLCGNIHYFPDIMSAYRVNTPGSWTQRTQSSNNRLIQTYENIIDALNRINKYTSYKYNNTICSQISRNEYLKNIVSRNYFRILIDCRQWKFIVVSIMRRTKRRISNNRK